MKNITKTLLVLVSALSISFAAVAGEMTITGAAKASYAIGGTDDSNAKGLGIGNELQAKASGEMDNGFTWSYQMELDPADGGAVSTDDSQLIIGMGDMGTIGIFDSEGGLSTELGYGVGALGPGTDYGGTMTISYGDDVSNYPNIQYHLPADLLPFGLGAKVGYAPNLQDGQGNDFKNKGPVQDGQLKGNNATHYQVTAAPLDGLKVGADYFSTEGGTATAQESESGNYYVQYAFNNFKVGYNKGHYAPPLTDKNTAATEYTNTAWGIEVAINDQLSISYNEEESERTVNNAYVAGASTNTKTLVTSDMETWQIAYVLGGATAGVHVSETKDADYTSGKEEKVTLFTLAMDF